MSLNAVPLPLSEPVVRPRDWKNFPDPKRVDPKEGTVTLRWAEYLTRQADIGVQSPRRMFSVDLRDQDASLGATELTDGALAAGVYRVSFYATVVQAATVSSSLTVTLDHTDRGASKAVTSAAMTGNTLGTMLSGTALIRVDVNSPVRYSTTYGSVGATALLYDLIVVLERVE